MRPARRPIGTSRAAHRSPVNALGVMTIVFVVAAVAVMAAILFAPKKPPAPPASKISYEGRPQQDISVVDSGSSFPASRRPKPRKTQEVTPAAAEKTEGRYVIRGKVTEAKTGKPIAKATVMCTPPRKAGAAKEPDPSPRRGRRRGQEPRDANRVRGITDETGQYTIRVDVAGAYGFEVSAPEFVRVRDQRGVLDEARGELVMDFTMSRGASISGRVTEAGSGRPAPDVHLRTQGPERQEAATDEHGAYTLGGLTPGDYSVMLNIEASPGYLAAGMVPSRNVTIKTETQEVTGIDFTVEIAGQVWGYVMTREGEAVSGTEVILCTSSSVFSQFAEASIKKAPPATGRSNEEGYYELTSVPLNKEWQLYAVTDERAPQLTAPFVLTPTQRIARIDVYVSPGTTVYGRVVGTDRKPIPGAEVICIPGYSKFFSAFDTPQAFRNQRSEEDGSFTLPHIPAGEYQILAQKKGYKFAAMGEPIYPNGFSDIRGVEVVLTPVTAGEVTIYGTVTDSAGKPLDGVKLTLGSMSVEDMSPGETQSTTDPEGKYVFTGVQAGVIVLRAEKPGYQGRNVSNVKLDEPTDIVLPAGSIIAGTVLVRETSAPPEQASVQAVRMAQSGGAVNAGFMMQDAYSRTNAGPDGRFELEVGEGDYVIEARATGLTPARTNVSVSAGQRLDDVVLYLRQSGARIAGRVLTSDGKSPQGALVWVAQDSGSAAQPGMGQDVEQRGIQVGADGAYEFTSLAGGVYTLQAKLEGYAQVQSAPIELAEGQAQSGIDLVLRLGNALEGRVLFAGRPEAGDIVTVVGNGINETTTTDASGFYRIERLQPGNYLATAVSLTGNAIAGLASALHARIEIMDGQTTTYNFGEPTATALAGICMPGPPPGLSAGYAILHLPGSGVDLGSMNMANPMSWFTGSGGLANSVVGMANVERDGYFRIDNLVAGEYVLDIVYGSFAEVRPVYSGSVTVTDGQVTQLNLQVGGM